ncbi:11089_t:CDS:2 [Paraglomus brasilianum]|uniref:11089_t:CDS:1 n=1 Tax=Paraglomus brasilianum TaxID=144538 RepID=A0A9N9CBI4_9GLOM|nr:11089_t:CDS:2 [Paraglomus brasilianum]
MAKDVLKKQEMYTERMEKLMQKANAMMLLSKSEERREGLSILRQEIDGLIDDLEYFRTIFDQQKWQDDESYRKFTSAALNMARSLSSDLHRKARTLKKDRPTYSQRSITLSRDVPVVDID